MNTNPNDNELLDALRESEAIDPTTPEQWSDLLSKLRAADGADAEPSADFARTLRRRWLAETTSARRPARNWWRAALPLAAAAVLAIVFLWPGGILDNPMGRPSSAVAWADVVRAMDRVPHFRVIVFSDDPRRADEKLKMFRIDLFYQQPNRWRGQGMGYVSFADATGKSRTWSVEKRRFLTKDDGHTPDLIPPEFVAAHAKLGTLGAILSTTFGGKIPTGEPVKSDEVSTAQGIDVFDYAQKASERWARIWVLRESRLPLKMHVYQPDSDEFMLVTFDYSDPQPPEFFDAENFATKAAKLDSVNVYRAYNIGSKPVAGTRPRGADQVYEVSGGYRAPKVKRILSNKDGDVLVVTDNPSNTTPQGRWPLEQQYDKVTDNWGNMLISFGGSTYGGGEDAERYWYFMPLPPAKIGTGPRTITLSYVVEPDHRERKVLSTETLDVPDPSVKGKDCDWKIDLAAEKSTWYRGYLQRGGTLARQLDEFDRIVAADPNDIAAYVWKFKLQREHGREEPAWKLFESSLRDRIFAEPKLLNRYHVEASQYLLYLASQNRHEELGRLSTKVDDMIRAARASEKEGRSGRERLSSLVRVEHNPLLAASQLVQWRQQYKDGPTVVRVLSSRDGLVFLELQIPTPPEGWQSNGWDGSAPIGWFWQPNFDWKQWQTQGRLVKLEEGRLWLVLRGDGKQIALAGEAMLAADNYNPKLVRNDAKLTWQRTIEVPEPTIDDMKAWWLKESAAQEKTWWPTPAAASQPAATQPDGPSEWMGRANTLRDEGQFAEAADLYDRAIAAPKEQWPSAYTIGVGINPDLVEVMRRQMRVSLAGCLADLGRIDDARKIASDLWSQLPATPDLSDVEQNSVAANALAADLHVPRVLLQRGDAKSASAELDRIARRRPDLTDVLNSLMVHRGSAKFGWNPRSQQEEAWRKFDALWWDVRDALAAKN